MSDMGIGLRYATLLWIGYWVALFVATHVPIDPRLSSRLPVSDLVIHGAVYALLTILGGWRLLLARSGGVGRSLVRWAIVYLAYGILDESLQPFTGRTASFADWLANLTGVVAGTGAVAAVSHAWGRGAGRGIETPTRETRAPIPERPIGEDSRM